MFSDPNIAEWFSGLLLMVVSTAVLVEISSLIALTVMEVLGDEEMQPQRKEKTLDTATIPGKRRPAA